MQVSKHCCIVYKVSIKLFGWRFCLSVKFWEEVKVEESEHIVYIIPKVGERRNKQECMHIKKLKRVNKHKQRVAELNHHQNDNTQ